jgi:hypothetical protein
MLQRLTIIGLVALSGCGPTVVAPPPACTVSTCAGCCHSAGRCLVQTVNPAGATTGDPFLNGATPGWKV